jgi:hypothetical protein
MLLLAIPLGAMALTLVAMARRAAVERSNW